MILENTKKFCKTHNIKIGQLEEIVGLSRGAIYKWSKSSPNIETVIKIADYFGISVDSLLGRDVPASGGVTNLQFSDAETNLITCFRQLNEEGQEKVLGYADDLVLSGRYIKNCASGMVE